MRHAVHAIDQGSGPPLLLVHGFPLNHAMWRHQIAPLCKQFRIIAPDLRGFGQSAVESSAAQTGISMAEYADDLANLLDDLHVNEPVTFCGFSMGGYIAWQFYERHRSKVRSLILCNTKAAADTPQTREMRYKMADGVEGWGSAHIATLMVPKLFAAGTLAENAELVAEVHGMISQTSPIAISAAQRGMARRDDKQSLLANINVPSLYVVGKDDQISPPAEMLEMANATPNSEYIEIADAGHMSPLEHPAAVTRAIEGFMEQLA